MDPREIQKMEIIKVRLYIPEEEVEEPTFAKVLINQLQDRELYVLFQGDDGCLDGQPSLISYDSVLEHYAGETNLWDVSGQEPIPDQEEEEEEDETLDGFIVPDDEDLITNIPLDQRREIDREWDSWKPKTKGEVNYKKRIDEIQKKFC